MKLRQFVFPITLLTLSSGFASAQIAQWTGNTSGNWNTGSNWSTGGVPSQGEYHVSIHVFVWRKLQRFTKLS